MLINKKMFVKPLQEKLLITKVFNKTNLRFIIILLYNILSCI